MAVNIALTSLANLQNDTTATNQINSNSTSIISAFQNVLARDGTTPNQMNSALDMNSQRILNLASPQNGTDPLRLQDYNTLLSGGTINISSAMGIEYIIDQGGTALQPGMQGFIQVPFNCTITSVTLLADQTGSCVVDIWKTGYSGFPPSVANTITASTIPTITAGIKYTDAVLTGWTTHINQGDILVYNVNSSSTITRLNVSLAVTKT